jgi:hypothetical protein
MRRPLFRSSAPIAMTVAKMIVPKNVIIADVPFYRSSAGTVGGLRVSRGRRRRRHDGPDEAIESRRLSAPLLLGLADDRNKHRTTPEIRRPR